jgi:Rrf2 family protein
MLSNSCKYGIRSIIYIALKNLVEERKIGIKEISKELNLPTPFLGKILLRLAKCNLLISTKGPHGGFLLSRPASEISLFDIIEVIDGTKLFEDCLIGLSTCSSHAHNDLQCPIHDKYSPISNQLKFLFKTETIENLASEIKSSGGKIGL